MYTFVNAVCLPRSIGSQWKEVDLSQILVFDIYLNYSKTYLVLHNDALGIDVNVDMETLKSAYSSYDDTLENLLLDLGNITLSTVPDLPSTIVKFARYSDAFRAEYKIELGKAGIPLPVGYPDSEKHDAIMTRPKYHTDMELVQRHCLVSVNGYYHWTDYHNGVVNIYDAAKSLRKSKNNTVGVLSFIGMGPLNKVKIDPVNILKIDQDTLLSNKLTFTTPVDLENKSYILVLGGYMIFPQDNVFWRSGNQEFTLELSKLPYVERILESSDYLDLSHLQLTPEVINPRAYNANEVMSDNVVKRYLTMTQSFLVVVDVPFMSTNKIHLRSSNLPGMFTSYQDPSYPLIVNHGKVAEYWKTHEDGHWSVTVNDSYLRNYVISQQPVKEGQTFSNNTLAGRPFYHSRGYLLEIAGFVEAPVTQGPQA